MNIRLRSYAPMIKEKGKEWGIIFGVFFLFSSLSWFFIESMWYGWLLSLFGLALGIFFNALRKYELNSKDDVYTFLIIGGVFSALFWFEYFVGGSVYVFLATTLALVVWKMWRARHFLGFAMANIEKFVFGKPLTKKWKKKMGYEDES